MPATSAKSQLTIKPATGSKHKPKARESWLTEFELTERSGKLISSESFRGQPLRHWFLLRDLSFDMCASKREVQDSTRQVPAANQSPDRDYL